MFIKKVMENIKPDLNQALLELEIKIIFQINNNKQLTMKKNKVKQKCLHYLQGNLIIYF